MYEIAQYTFFFLKKGNFGVKEALHKRLCIPPFPLYEVLKQLFYGKVIQNSGCLWEMAQSLTGKGHAGTLLGDDSVLYLDKSLSYTGVYICQNSTNVNLIFVHLTGSKF